MFILGVICSYFINLIIINNNTCSPVQGFGSRRRGVELCGCGVVAAVTLILLVCCSVYGNYKWRLMGAGVQKPCKLYHALPLAYPPGEIAPSPMLPVYCMAGLA